MSRDKESLKPRDNGEKSRDKRKRDVEVQERMENALIEQSKYIDKMRYAYEYVQIDV